MRILRTRIKKTEPFRTPDRVQCHWKIPKVTEDIFFGTDTSKTSESLPLNLTKNNFFQLRRQFFCSASTPENRRLSDGWKKRPEINPENVLFTDNLLSLELFCHQKVLIEI